MLNMNLKKGKLVINKYANYYYFVELNATL